MACLERGRVFLDPAVPGDQVEAELADVARLDLAHLARHQVVMEELHEGRLEPCWPICPSTPSWTFDPLQVVPSLLLAVLYARRVRTLRARGTAVPGWRIALFATGIAILLVALVSPVHALGEQLFSFHMLQHVLLGDLAPLALLAGLTGPILRPALAFLHRLRFLANPLIALPLWAVNLYVWHLPYLYDAAVRHDSVHALEHLCFFTAGAIMWLPVLETLPAPEWFGTGAKIGYIAVVRVVETVLGNVFFWAGAPSTRLSRAPAAPLGTLTACRIRGMPAP